MAGSFTGMNKAGISVGEKVGGVPNSDITYIGQPWMWVLRDTLQFAHNLNDVHERLEHANRTMAVHLGWGSAEDERFEGCDYAHNYVEFYDDKHYDSNFSDSHP